MEALIVILIVVAIGIAAQHAGVDTALRADGDPHRSR